MEKKGGFVDEINAWTNYWYFVVATYFAYLFIKIGKKISDFLFQAAIDKIILSFESEVRKVVKEEIDPVRRNIHGLIEKNEGVLNEALEEIKNINNKNEV